MPNRTPRKTITLDAKTHRELCVMVEDYERACEEDGEANEASNNIADLLVAFKRRGGLR